MAAQFLHHLSIFFGNYVIWPEQPENIGTTLFILALNIEEKLISNVGL